MKIINYNEESKKMEQELEGNIANELEKEMEEDQMEKEEYTTPEMEIIFFAHE